VSAPLEQGETYQYRQTVTDASGVPTNAGTVTGTITLPDGSTATPTIVNSGAGLYDFDYLTTQAGRHTLLVSATGGTLGSAVEKFDDTFNVEEPGRLLVSFDEARTELRGTSTITTLADREQLRWLILAASDGVERALGRTLCWRTGLIEYFDGGTTDLTFSRQPLPHPDGLIVPTTVVEDGNTLVENTDYKLRRMNGVWRLRRGTSSSTWYWASGNENIVVTYAAGSRKIPPILRRLVLTQIQEYWQESQQASHPLLDENSVEQAVGAVTASTQVDRDAWRTFQSLGVA